MAGFGREARTLFTFAAMRLPSDNRPRQYPFIDPLPRTPNGKLRRAALRSTKP